MTVQTDPVASVDISLPSLGRIVHFVAHDGLDYAGIISGNVSGTKANVYVIPNLNAIHARVHYDVEFDPSGQKKPSWHWPLRIKSEALPAFATERHVYRAGATTEGMAGKMDLSDPIAADVDVVPPSTIADDAEDRSTITEPQTSDASAKQPADLAPDESAAVVAGVEPAAELPIAELPIADPPIADPSSSEAASAAVDPTGGHS